MAFTREEFENRCMDIIAQIVSIDPKLDRQGAIIVAEKLLERAKGTDKKLAIDIYTRVLKEFQISTDEEYNLLRKQIFEK